MIHIKESFIINVKNMKNYHFAAIAVIGIALVAGGIYYSSKKSAAPPAPQKEMTFFLTSSNPGKGGDLGGLSGADSYCQSLASSAGAGDRTWRAYLSATATAGSPAVNARDRIGNGPWQNANGVVIANDIENLHSDNNALSKETAVSERGEIINGRGDTPNRHDILTGSDPDGRAIATSSDSTCGNWTKSGDGSAMLGHHDRVGLRDDAPSKSWNSSHFSRGCSLEALASTGGNGLFYCFAAD